MANKVLVGVSGGVDSSVSAAILKDKGFEVTGAFMKNWEDDDGTPYCSVKEDFFDAARVCDKLGIELIQLNFAKEYKEKVFEYFLDSLKNGKTPNPDIFCNKFIKFDAFYDYAIKNNFDRIATGPYCQIKHKVVFDQGNTYIMSLEKNLPVLEEMTGIKVALINDVSGRSAEFDAELKAKLSSETFDAIWIFGNWQTPGLTAKTILIS
jgi:predicted PP-loop superfamily ATPase